uniref:HEPN AbiJ-N-terminal domain-containing protein n=1 Tax=Geobacter sp. (strain M21) TaxID=443144 RepID=C6E3N9_GEOSM
MSKFSSRYGYDPRDTGPLKVEEAPEWLRISFSNGILDNLTYIDGDTRYTNTEDRPLGIREIAEKMYLILREEPDDSFYDSWTCNESLKWLIKKVEWFHFYDFVELIGKELRESEEWRLDDDWSKSFGANQYREKVNTLFEEQRIAWRLNSNFELVREVPGVLKKAVKYVELKLVDEFEPAREHYRKAYRYIYELPTDPENGIKEIVSALESIGRTLYEGTVTLGDVIKKLKHVSEFPQGIVSVMEKFYGYACSEPAVRHGSSQSSRVGIEDAEFCFHVGIALVRYLTSKKGKRL